MLKRTIVVGIVISMVTLVGCSNQTSKVREQVEVEMTEILEGGKEIVIEPLSESEIDVNKRIETELKSNIAEITGFEEEAITLMLSLHGEPSCSIFLGTELTIEDTVIEEIKQNIVQIVLKENVTIREEEVVITNMNGNVLH